MDKAIITLTKGGIKLGLKLLNEYEDSVLYINKRFDICGDRILKIQNDIQSLIPQIFHKYRCLIFIMATGIVVRVIAPHIKSKTVDPAVIVLDEKGKNVISLLSGHLGFANEYTLDIARRLNSNPVITTSSDVNETLAVDTIAIKLNCIIENMKNATKVTAHIVNGEMVGIESQINIDFHLPYNIKIIRNSKDYSAYKGIIFITNENMRLPRNIDAVLLRPKNLIIGIGCRRGIDKEKIISAIKDALNKANKSILSVKKIATIDLKKDEKGILEAAKYMNVPLEIISSGKVKEIEHKFQTSDFVKKSIGVGAVAEPVAVLASNKGRLILNKRKYDGITIALVEEGDC
ncbi:cobalt-precorrin 5A hydrolase [Caloranaerobacter sp. DY30410]|uniref:cobalt-precorrin 5A hydrolase n=1 Tax=Caloranaerobacter sp. DY30410 TaxID=3238305 RepID=UPI003D07CD56